MRTPGSRVPFALRLAVRLLPEEVREEVLGDLLEHWSLRVKDQRWLGRVSWAWRQPLSSFAARIRFGHRSVGRPGMTIGRIITAGHNIGAGVSWLDFKLGIRKLIRYPGLTLVSGCAIAVAVAIGASSYVVFGSLINPTLPLDEGERVVGIQLWDPLANQEAGGSIHDFYLWREELGSLQDLSAFRSATRNMIAPDGAGVPVLMGEMTASGFQVARVSPLFGRALLEEDEREGAPLVIVIGYDVWQSHFLGDPDVIGRSVQVDGVSHDVVGVMPEEFAFPLYYDAWTPLRVDPLAYQQSEGPAIQVFGRLRPGISRENAQTELMTLGFRRAQLFPGSNKRLQPRVLSLPEAWQGQASDRPAPAYGIRGYSRPIHRARGWRTDPLTRERRDAMNFSSTLLCLALAGLLVLPANPQKRQADRRVPVDVSLSGYRRIGETRRRESTSCPKAPVISNGPIM